MDMPGMNMTGAGHGNHAPGSHLSYTCDGTHWTGMAYQRPSNWSAHVAPGAFVVLWALHWTVGVFKSYLTSSRQAPYLARTTYDLPLIPRVFAPEGYLKIIVPFVMIMCQLWWSHGHWSRSICEDGTVRAGHFAITAVHNWQNAWTLFGYLMAGVVDVLSVHMQLPPHFQHFTTSLAFGLQGFALYQGQHQDMLDNMMYFLLALLTATTSVVMLAEMALPEAFWLGCVKVFSLWMQAVWYLTLARFLFEGRPAWETLQPKPDMSPEMFVPVVLVMWMNIVAMALLLVYVAMRWWYSAHLNEHLRNNCSVERTLITVAGGGQRAGPATSKSSASAAEARGAANHELVPLVFR